MQVNIMKGREEEDDICDTKQNNKIKYSTMQCNTVLLYTIVQNRMAQYGTVQYNSKKYNTTLISKYI